MAQILYKIFDYVIRPFNVPSAELKSPWGLDLPETPLSAISRLNWSPESTKARPLFTELQQQIHDDLRIQHPEWVEPNG